MSPNKYTPVSTSLMAIITTSFCCSENNLVVEFKLVWRNKQDDPLKKLRSATKNGKLGHMKIDTDSVKEKS